MYKTIKKEIERRGEALDTVWFLLDNTCRENKNKYADLHEELRVLTYNPITINTSTQRRKRRRGAQAATTTVERSNEADSEADRQEGGQAVAIPLENEDTTRREFDARPGNLVVMDNTADNPDAYREEGLLGDWENKCLVAYGTPDIPLTFAIAAARQNRDP
eukprot:jgi/Tetstr1/461998/TSEL_007069.t1